jgi:protein-L-isoaspartate(D-aspartate) O-methyltransferase
MATIDFERARAQMVESQLRAGGVTNAAILAEMRAIPREDFVDPARRDMAYLDDIQWLGGKASGRFMAPPVLLAKLIKLAGIAPSDRVLDVGAASGYSSAVIAGLAGSVTGLERDAKLAECAAENLARLGIHNAEVVVGDIDSLPSSQFDVIIVQGALDRVPDQLLASLAEGGRLVALLRKGAISVATVTLKVGGRFTSRSEFNASLPPLGKERHEDEFVF